MAARASTSRRTAAGDRYRPHPRRDEKHRDRDRGGRSSDDDASLDFAREDDCAEHYREPRRDARREERRGGASDGERRRRAEEETAIVIAVPKQWQPRPRSPPVSSRQTSPPKHRPRGQHQHHDKPPSRVQGDRKKDEKKDGKRDGKKERLLYHEAQQRREEVRWRPVKKEGEWRPVRNVEEWKPVKTEGDWTTGKQRGWRHAEAHKSGADATDTKKAPRGPRALPERRVPRSMSMR